MIEDELREYFDALSSELLVSTPMKHRKRTRGLLVLGIVIVGLAVALVLFQSSGGDQRLQIDTADGSDEPVASTAGSSDSPPTSSPEPHPKGPEAVESVPLSGADRILLEEPRSPEVEVRLEDLGLCVRVGTVDLGCTDPAVEHPPGGDEYSPLTASDPPLPNQSINDAIDVAYGLLPPRTAEIVIEFGDGRTTTGPAVARGSRFWAIRVLNGVVPSQVTFLDESGDVVLQRERL